MGNDFSTAPAWQVSAADNSWFG